MKVKHTLFTIVLLLLSWTINAQTGSIKGFVRDKEGQPVQFATITIEGKNIGTVTNENGFFSLSKIPAGEQVAVVQYTGFEPMKKAVLVNEYQEVAFDFTLNESTQNLAAVKITGQKRRTASATKMNMELRDIPMSIQVIGQDVIQQQQIFDLKDVVKNVSGMNQTGSYNGGYQYFNSRGFDMNNWTNFRRNGTLLWNMGNHYADFYESIEFLKGPAAILYGDVAPGGIMNFVTKKPLNYDYRRIELKVGTYGLFRPTIDISGNLTEKKNLLYRMNATYEKSKSFRNVVENETYMLAPSIQWSISPKLTWLVEGTLKADNRVGDPGIVSPDGTFEGLKRISNKTFLGEREATYTYNNKSAYSTLKYRINDNWSIQNLTSYNSTERTPLNIYANNDADADGNITRYQYFFNQRFETWTSAVDVVGEFTTGVIKHKVLLGGDYVYDQSRMGGFLQENISSTMNIFHPEYGAAKLKSLPRIKEKSANFTARAGIYVQDQLSFFNEKLNVLVGARYNNYTSGTVYDNASDKPADYSEVTSDPIVPRFGVVYKPKEFLSIYGSYAESYEINGFDWIDVTKLIPPTKGKQTEIGVKGDFLQEKLGVTVAFFTIDKKDAYNWGYSEAPPTFEYISWTPGEGAYFTYLAPKHQSRGIELDIHGKLLHNLSINASASYIVAQVVEDPGFKKGNWLANQPRQMGNIWATYKFNRFLKGFDVGYGVFYRGEFYAEINNAPSNKARSQHTMDASIGYTHKNFRTQLNVTNFTNQINYLGSYGNWEPQWTRRAVFSVAYKF